MKKIIFTLIMLLSFAIWNYLTASMITPDSIGKKLADNPQLDYSNITNIVGTEIANNFP